jgi:hypothetical protein
MKGVIESFGVVRDLDVARFLVVEGPEDLVRFGFPCFLKVNAGVHKTDEGGVAECFNLADAERKLWAMHKRFPDTRIIVQEGVEGVEMIVGLKRDEVFGRVLLVGFGGIFVEVKRDVSFRALPVSRKDVKEMVAELEGFGVFGARGKRYDLERFYDLVLRVSRLDVDELDLNPVIVGENFVKVVDARIE